MNLEIISKIIVDALDVDIQLWCGKVLSELRRTPTGNRFASWAGGNPVAFEVMLRAISVVAQKVPHDRGLILETARDQLSRLPVEIRRVTIADDRNQMPQALSELLSDASFVEKYEAALVGLPEDDLTYIASLSPSRLQEWVLSPVAIRAHKLRTWRTEAPSMSATQKLAVKVRAFNDGLEQFRAKRLKRNRSS